MIQMDQETNVLASTDEATAEPVETAETVDELLIEEISIDGMCGVY